MCNRKIIISENPGEFIDRSGSDQIDLVFTNPVATDDRSNLFEPSARNLVLINGKDLDVIRFSKENNYTRFQTCMYRGNRNIYDLEIALSGNLKIENNGWHKKYNKKDLKQIYNYIHKSISNEIQEAKIQREQIKYNKVYRIYPDENMLEKFENIISRLSKITTKNQLTTFIIYSHGQEDGFEMDLENLLSYKYFLEKTELLKGKKIIILAACYSGNIIEYINQLKTASNYSVITSTNNQLGWNWSDDIFFEKLQEGILKKLTLNEFKNIFSEEISNGDHSQTPKVLINFNTII